MARRRGDYAIMDPPPLAVVRTQDGVECEHAVGGGGGKDLLDRSISDCLDVEADAAELVEDGVAEHVAAIGAWQKLKSLACELAIVAADELRKGWNIRM